MRFRSALILVAVMTLTGCANKCPQETVSAREIEREMTSHQLAIALDQGQLLASDSLKVQATEAKSYHIKELTNTTTYNAYTPYQGAREIYELPLGLIATAGGVVINVVDFALLGLLPNNLTDGALNVGFAGINPFMNIESQSRKELAIASTQQAFLDERDERTEMPVTGRSLTVASMEKSYLLELDEKGAANVSLLELFETLPLSSELDFSLEVDGAKIQERVILSRQLRAKLFQAKNILAKHNDGAATQGDLDIAAAVGDILALSNLGFERASQKLEGDLTVGLTPAEQEQLLVALGKASVTEGKDDGAIAEPQPVAETADDLSVNLHNGTAMIEMGTENGSLPDIVNTEISLKNR